MATTRDISKEQSGTGLSLASPESLGLDSDRLDQLETLIEKHIAEGRYPGAQYAIARHGQLARVRTLGNATAGQNAIAATDDMIWLLFSQTKVVTVAAIWQLVDKGALRFADRIADHVPEFSRNGKGEITVHQLLTHQGGFPDANVTSACWEDHDLLREAVCDFTLDWTPGSKVRYHSGSAHWVAAVLIEALTGHDFRDVIHDNLIAPIGLDSDIFVGVPPEHQERCTNMYKFEDGQMTETDRNTPEYRAVGVPGGGGFGTAAGLAAFYQMLLMGGTLNGTRVLSPRVIQFATRNHTGERVDERMGMPMHRGIGPHVRGFTPTIRGLGTIASPSTFGHGGAGSSYSWADPESGVSFSYLSNCQAPEPWHSARLDSISNIAHAAIVEP